jgi:hypothetical protein
MGTWLVGVLTSSAATALLIGALAWLCREWVSTRLTARVRLETERELTDFRSRLESTEQHVRDVRQAGIEGARSTNAAVIAERVTATKALARMVIDWRSMATISAVIGVITPEMAVRGATDQGMRDALGKMWDAGKVEQNLNQVSQLSAWRPFVTEAAWAQFAALQGFYVARMTKTMCMRTGNVELARRMWAVDGERKIVSTVAPELLEAYDRNPAEIEGIFLEKLGNDLLTELRRGLSGEHEGVAALQQALAITSTADEVTRETQRAQQPKPEGLGDG